MDQVKQNLQNEITELQNQLEESKKLLETENDSELTQMAVEEIAKLEAEILNLKSSIESLEGIYTEEKVTQDLNINPNTAIVEIRAGTGGTEAALFAYDLYRMYVRYAEIKKWKTEELSLSEAEMGGIKSVTFEINGQGVYIRLQHESGVHRVQRIPSTEASGRIHTSAATVAVLPKLKKITLEIKEEDIKMDFFRSGGSGGQNVNKVSTAVRLTHMPTGVVVECQEQRTQGKNRQRAMEVLEARLYQMMQEQQIQKIEDLRANQVGSGDRSEKIRTYNFPQDRITDHRVNLSWHNIPIILNGNLDEMLKELNQGLLQEQQSS